MRVAAALLVPVLGVAPAPGATPHARTQHDHVRGVDVSSVLEVESGGGVYTRAGVAADPFEILRDAGVNLARIRVWVDPTDGCCGPDDTLALARRAADAGLDLLIDFHYSDTWADPGQQTPPAAWAGLGLDDLKAAVRAHTASVLSALDDQGTPAAFVQVGNEITNGVLWPHGAVSAWDDSNWTDFAAILNAGVAGVRDAERPGRPIGVILHIDAGADAPTSRAFFDRAEAFGVAYDAIGLSFYPWWHGALDDLGANIAGLADRFDTRVLVVETAYPFTLGWNDATHNIVGLPEQLHPGHPATPEGQRAFLDAVFDRAAEGPPARPGGVVYWGGELISAPGRGSPWENLALFDFAGEATGALGAFDRAHALDADGDGALTVDDLYALHRAGAPRASIEMTGAALRAPEPAGDTTDGR